MEGKQTLQANVLSVKIKFDEDIRRLSCPLNVSWEQLKAEVLAKYGLDPKVKLSVKYEDEEGDLVTLASEADLKEALQIISTTKFLRLTIVKAKHEHKLANTTPASSAVIATTTSTGPTSGVPGNVVSKEEFKRIKKEHKHEKKEHKHEDKAQLKEMKRAMKEQAKQQKEAAKAAKGPKFVARFVKDVATPDETELAPDTAFVKTWRFRNEGDSAWPEGCQLIFVSKLNGDQMGAPASVAVPSALVGQEIDVSVSMIAPSTPGRYVGYWRLCTADGKKFGQRVRVLIQVVASSSSSSGTSSSSSEEEIDLAPMLKQMAEMGFDDSAKNARVLKKHQGNLAAAVACLRKQEEKKAEKKAEKAAKKAEKAAKKAEKAEKKAEKKVEKADKADKADKAEKKAAKKAEKAAKDHKSANSTPRK